MAVITNRSIQQQYLHQFTIVDTEMGSSLIVYVKMRQCIQLADR
jgi:hypothetical protein